MFLSVLCGRFSKQAHQIHGVGVARLHQEMSEAVGHVLPTDHLPSPEDHRCPRPTSD